MAANEPWWKSAVLYQIYPRSFSDASGTGTGDLKGITRKLPYLADLGIDAIWISPFFKSPMNDFGYDVEDHRTVDPLFGTNEDFDHLLAEAHALGIRVMIDLVLSHCAETHVWFQECLKGKGSAYDEAFIWVDPAPDGGPPNNWLSIFGGNAWTYNENRGQYYLHNFLKSQPDLNYHSTMVRAEALSIARYWLDKGVDGFRLDAINFCMHDPELRDNPPATTPDGQCVQLSNPYGTMLHVYDKNHSELPAFLEELRAVMDTYEDRVTLGEIGATRERSQELMSEYTRPGRLNLCYSFDLLTGPLEAEHFKNVAERLGALTDRSWGCWALSNHDVPRAATRFAQEESPTDDIAAASLAVLLSFRGTPCLYQGEELGLEEAEIDFEDLVDPYGIAFYPEFKGRDGCRTPMPWTHSLSNGGFCPEEIKPWLPVQEKHLKRAADLAQANEQSVFHCLRALLRFRKKHSALSLGSMRIVTDAPRILKLERSLGEEVVVCVFNLSSETVTIRQPSNWKTQPGLNRGISQSSVKGQLLMAGWSWYLQVSTGVEIKNEDPSEG